jgi:putative transposase
LNSTAAADRIKYIYIQGKRINAQVLTVIDVFSRWNMGHIIKWNIRQQDVILLFNEIFDKYDLPLQFYVRNDNGSQFVADLVQQYFRDKNIVQEFTKPATPEQNAHVDWVAGAILSQYHGKRGL